MKKGRMKKGRMKAFSHEEDELLIALVSQYGDKNFEEISAQMNGRTIRQLRYRYTQCLSLKMNEPPWTQQEDAFLLKKFADCGKNWKIISKFFPARSINNIKSRYNRIKNSHEHELNASNLQNSNEATEDQTREIIDIEDTLKPYMDPDLNDEDKGQSTQVSFDSNSTPSLNYFPQERNAQPTAPSQAIPNPNMKKLSCFQNGQISYRKYRTFSGSHKPICVDSVINGYCLQKEIGRGAYSSVALATKVGSNQMFAAKIIPMESLRNTPLEQLIMNEIQIIQGLDHPNVVKYYEHFETPDKKYIIIITECCVLALWQYMNLSNKNNEEIKKIAFGIVSGLLYLHQNHISHSDIKIENILLDENMIPKICDFGFARYHKNSSNDTIPPLTPMYAGPEAYRNRTIDLFKNDVYALGITLYMLSTRDKEYYSVTDQNEIKIRALFTNLPIDPNDGLQRLAARCTIKNPDYRPSMEEVIEDDFFDE